jgi:molybdopterin converting factor small subunit
MTVTVHLHEYYREFTGSGTVKVEGGTVREVFEALERQYPGIGEHLLDERGRIQGFAEVFVNNEIVHPEKIDVPLKDGDYIEVLTIVTGG